MFVSVKRLNTFFNAEEIDPDNVYHEPNKGKLPQMHELHNIINLIYILLLFSTHPEDTVYVSI